MKTLYRLISFILVFSFLLAGCDLPEITPPTEEAPLVNPSPSLPVVQPTVDEAPGIPPAILIDSNNVRQIIQASKAPVSNIQGMEWAADSLSLAVITQNSDSVGNQVYGVTLLNVADLKPLSVYSNKAERVAAIAPDGITAALIRADQLGFSLVNVSTNSVAQTISLDYPIMELSFSSDMKYIAASKQDLWEVVLFDLKTLQEAKTLTGFETAAPVYRAGFSQSPQWVIWNARATIQLQEVASGTLSLPLSHEDFVSTYVTSSDGTILATAAAKSINGDFLPIISLWDTTTGQEIQTIPLSKPVNALDFSPDGKLLAAAVGNEIQIWDPATAVLLTTLTGHLDTVVKIAFSPDQHHIATAAIDNQLYLWQVGE